MTLFDLPAAFNTIDHSILLDQLCLLHGRSGMPIPCFSLYLSDSTQSVAIDNHISPAKELHYGECQGSILGPILFVL